MIIPGWPTPKSCLMSARTMPQAWTFFAEHGITESRLSGCSPTTAPASAAPSRRPWGWYQAQVHPPVPAAKQRRSQTGQPHPARGMGLRAAERLQAFPAWLLDYNQHRGDTSLKGCQPPAARIPNLRGQCTYPASSLGLDRAPRTAVWVSATCGFRARGLGAMSPAPSMAANRTDYGLVPWQLFQAALRRYRWSSAGVAGTGLVPPHPPRRIGLAMPTLAGPATRRHRLPVQQLQPHPDPGPAPSRPARIRL